MQQLLYLWACCLALCARGSRAALLEGYRGLLATHPLRTNMVTASILSVASDAIAQSVERRNAAALVPKKQPLQQQQQQQLDYGAGEAGDVQGQGNNRSLVQVGRTLTVNSIVGLKRPSRPVQLDSRPAELDSADLGLFYGGGGGGGGGGSINGGGLPGRTGGRAKKTRGSTGGLFPGPPAHVEETQVVTWHESQSQPE